MTRTIFFTKTTNPDGTPSWTVTRQPEMSAPNKDIYIMTVMAAPVNHLYTNEENCLAYFMDNVVQRLQQETEQVNNLYQLTDQNTNQI